MERICASSRSKVLSRVEIAAAAEWESDCHGGLRRVRGGVGCERKDGPASSAERADAGGLTSVLLRAMFQLLPNGNIVLANWQGHGTGFGNSGVQLMEFNVAGEMVWSWSKGGFDLVVARRAGAGRPRPRETA